MPRNKNRKNKLFWWLFLIVLLGGIVLLLVLLQKETPSLDSSGEISDISPVPTKQVDVNTLYSSLEQKNFTNGPLSGKIIILDPGHGGTEPGCTYPSTAPIYFEKDFNLAIAKATKENLVAQGATVILLREEDLWSSLYQRMSFLHLLSLKTNQAENISPLEESTATKLEKALQQSATINLDSAVSGGMGIMTGTGIGEDLATLFKIEENLDHIIYLSIHINANESTNYHGNQVYYTTNQSVVESEKKLIQTDSQYQNNPDYPIRDNYSGRDEAKSFQLATAINQSIVSQLPHLETNMPHAVQGGNYAVLRENNLAAVLIEVAFLTNNTDREWLLNPQSAQQTALGITQGCIEYFN